MRISAVLLLRIALLFIVLTTTGQGCGSVQVTDVPPEVTEEEATDETAPTSTPAPASTVEAEATAEAESTVEDDTKVLVEAAVELGSEAAGNLAAIVRDVNLVYGEDFVDLNNDTGRDAIADSVLRFRTAIPDLHSSILLIVTQGASAAVLVSNEGTFSSPYEFRGGATVPPTDDQVDLYNVAYYETANGQIVQQIGTGDYLAFAFQFGLWDPFTDEVLDVSQLKEGLANLTQGEQADGSDIENALDRLREAGFSPMVLDSSGVNGIAFAEDVLLANQNGLFDVEGATEHWSSIYTAMPDMRFAFRELIIDPPWLAGHGRLEGTHTGTLTVPDVGDYPATNNEISLPVYFFVHLDGEGDIDAALTFYDRLNLYTQTGVLRQP